MTEPIFEAFDKIGRLSRLTVITEKIDGTNAQICIPEEGGFFTGSRNGWITPEKDNFGFSRWANEHKEELLKLGPGRHFGEWWGSGIQRRYDLTEKRFSLFNVGRWTAPDAVLPACVHLVPTLYRGIFSDAAVLEALETLRREGSRASPGFMKPEGVIVYHAASRTLFKKTLEKDEMPKGMTEAA
jgi:hypothetical protein